MTIQQSIDTMQAWTYALRILIGYPAFAPVSHTITFASGGRRNPLEAPLSLAPPFCRSFNVASTYPVGLSAVKGEQHGFVTGWNSINSTRVPSGS